MEKKIVKNNVVGLSMFYQFGFRTCFFIGTTLSRTTFPNLYRRWNVVPYFYKV